MVCVMLSKIFGRAASSREKGRVPVPPREREPSPTWKPQSRSGASARRVALHFKASAAPRDMRDDRLAAMNFRDGAQVDGEGELDDRSLHEAEIAGLDENAVGGQVVRLAECAATPGDHHIYGGPRAMPAVKPPLHFP